MADAKISDLTSQTGASAATGDLFVTVDVSDPTMAGSGTDKKITAAELGIALATLGIIRPASAQHLPTGALAATVDRATALSGATPIVSGTLFLQQITLVPGPVTSISTKSAATAAVTPTHWWFGLFDINRVALAFTADQTSAAWAANAVKTVNLSAPYTITTAGDYYLGFMVTAGTVPNFFSSSLNANVTNIPPILCGSTSDTGLTTVPGLPFTAGTITAGTAQFLAWVS